MDIPPILKAKSILSLSSIKSVSETEKAVDKKEKGDRQGTRKDEQRCAMP
jgi:hypothetical protein